MKKTKQTFLNLLILSLVLLSGCRTQTYLMVAEGESFEALTQITDFDYPCIHPRGGDNGSNLVFTARESGGYYNIYFKDNALSRAVVQKTHGNNYNMSPDFNKETEKIAFQYYTGENFNIYYIDAYRGRALTQVTYSRENEYNPRWSKDGSLIVFERGAPPRLFIEATKSTLGAIKYTSVAVTRNQVWLKNQDSGELKMLGEGSFPTISPDGQNIAFVKYDRDDRNNVMGTIWVMSIDGDSQKRLTDSQMGYASSPSWSPQGDRLVFHLTKRGKTGADIYSINIDGERLIQHTTNKSNDFFPYWTEDNYIYFSSDRGGKKGNYQIWRFRI